MSDQINLPSMTIPELQEMITNSIKAAMSSWTPPQALPSEEKKFLSRKELCDQFGIAYPTLDRLIKTGVLPTYKVGKRRIFFRKEEVDKFLLNSREY